MPKTLFAACRVDSDLLPKRIPLDAQIQEEIGDTIYKQGITFRGKSPEEIPYDGKWKPDANQLLFIDAPTEALELATAVKANPISTPPIETRRFANEGIKALFTSEDENRQGAIFIQRFDRRQMLGHKLSLRYHNNAFRRISEAAFTLPTSITCVLEDGRLKFKSWSNLRTIFNLIDVYKAATDAEVRVFGQHALIEVSDLDELVEVSDQQMRKMINQVLSEGILNKYTATTIQGAASQTGLNIKVANDRILWPPERSQQKEVLQFLVENRYTGPLSGTNYVTNSRRPA